MMSSTPPCPYRRWRPKKRHLTLAFLIGAAAYQAHVHWSSIKHAVRTVYEIVGMAVQGKIITTDRRVQDSVQEELAPLLNRIERLERAHRRAKLCVCPADEQRRPSAPRPFKFPASPN